MKLFPSSRFPFIALKDCGTIITGTTPSKDNNAFWDGDIPFVTPSHLGNSSPIFGSDEYVTNAGAKNARLLPPSTVLVCCIGSLGKTGITGVPVVCNQQINAIVFDPTKINNRYGYHAACNLSPLLSHYAPSTTIKIVKKSAFAEFQIPLPTLEEQKRIAGILDAADALRIKRREAIAQLDALLQSTFLDLFGDPITNPKGWEKLTISEALQKSLLVDIQDGNHGERHPKVADFSEHGVPFIMANCMCNGAVDISRAYRLPENWLQKLRVGFAHGGDVLLSHKGTVGEVAVVPDNVGSLILSPQVTYYRPSRALSSHFLANMFATDGFQHLLDKEAKQSTRAYIGILRQKKLPVIIPPVNLQRKFHAVAKSVEAQKSLTVSHLTELDALFSSLQQRAFQGEL